MLPNFATTADMELVLQQAIPADKEDAAEFALLTASMAVRNYCRQLIHLVADDVVRLWAPHGRLLFLPELPVVSVASVTENDVALTANDDYVLQDYAVLYKRTGFKRLWNNPVVVQYTHGYADIPDDIRVVTARAASRLYQAGLRAAESAGVPGLVSKSLGDFSVTYGGENAVEGTTGVTAARTLLLSEKDLLNRFRV